MPYREREKSRRRHRGRQAGVNGIVAWANGMGLGLGTNMPCVSIVYSAKLAIWSTADILFISPGLFTDQ